ncbi:MAG: oligosaccharide flippase family protein [Prevotellaceae bacterium]|jgi:O-antigen/teichoic acid export membrane protein|nr:oligosaccharide flippase family protein [Prevotellaceae bacterium]
MSTIKKNIIANYIGRIWGFISIFIFVPFYLKILGVESYAVIQFHAVLLGIMAFADAGLTATLSREFARADKNDNYKANLLRTFEYCYLAILIFVATVIVGFSSVIAEKWLNIEHIQASDIALYIKLIGISIALQMMTTLYQGGLIGLQKQVLANTLSIGWNVCRSGLILIPLYFFPSLHLFFIWQVVLNALYLLTLKKTVSGSLKPVYKPMFHKKLLSGVWRFALGMMGMSLLSSILIQSDKLIVSNILSLTEFGYYSLASAMGQMPMMLTTPIGIAVYPKLTQLVSGNKTSEEKRYFGMYSFITVSIGVTLMLVLFCYAQDYLFIWTRKHEIASAAYRTVRVLCIGTFFQITQLVPYYIGVAHGHTRTNVIIGICSVIFIIPALIFSAEKWGLIGAAFPWLIMSIVTFFALSAIVLKKFLPHIFMAWFGKNILLPVLVAFAVFVPIYLLCGQLPQGNWTMLYGSLAAVAMLGGCALCFQKLYSGINIICLIKQILNK